MAIAWVIPACVYDWRVIDGNDKERAAGRARDLDSAADRIIDALTGLPANEAAVGVIVETCMPGTGVPPRARAAVRRDGDGRITWTLQ